MALPLEWLQVFATGTDFPICRRFTASAGISITMVFDASPSGGGAVLYVGDQFGQAILHVAPLSYWTRTWTPEDAVIIGHPLGDPAGQARWEALALLIAFTTWLPVIATARGTVAVMGDALGVLQSYFSFRAIDSIINSIMLEVAVQVAPLGRDLPAFHIFSEANDIADMLSKMTKHIHVPACLQDVRASTPRMGPWRFLRSHVAA